MAEEEKTNDPMEIEDLVEVPLVEVPPEDLVEVPPQKQNENAGPYIAPKDPLLPVSVPVLAVAAVAVVASVPLSALPLVVGLPLSGALGAALGLVVRALEDKDVASEKIRPTRGGTIRLPHHGISLSIPALALQEKYKITLKVLQKPSSVLFTEDEAIVSPGVVCEPSGTTFYKPLKLVIPHCAVLIDPSKAKFTMHFSHGDAKVTSKDLSSTVTPRCVVGKDDLEVYINHFSIFEMAMVISDNCIGKRVASTPYLPKSMSRLRSEYCHLRLYNDTPGLEYLIKKEEEKLGYRKMAPTKKMFVLWEKGELKIRCDVDNGHVTENEKTLSIDDIYRWDRKVVYFLVEATGDADVYIKFNFHPPCDEGHAFKVKFSDGDIASNLQRPSTTNSLEPDYGTSWLKESSSSSESSPSSERKHGAHIESEQRPFTTTSVESEVATLSVTEESVSSEWKEVGQIESEQRPFTTTSLESEVATLSVTEGSVFSEWKEVGQIGSEQRPFTTTSLESKVATLSVTEGSVSSEWKEVAKIGSDRLLAIPTRFDDTLLKNIAEEIETDEHLDRLMQALEVTQASQLRYHQLNRLEGCITAKGTRNMLRDWRAETAVIYQRERLKDALTRARLLDLRDRFFPSEKKLEEEDEEDE